MLGSSVETASPLLSPRAMKALAMRLGAEVHLAVAEPVARADAQEVLVGMLGGARPQDRGKHPPGGVLAAVPVGPFAHRWK